MIVGSVTMATRLKKKLEAASGQGVSVVHTPAKLAKTSGCSYSVRADNKLYSMIHPLCDEHGIHIKKIYLEEAVGKERIYSAVP
ncbi:MAG: putative Se/S carrier-like protein [Clostridia bacterium]|nr:putative Se/S carrier-like protein [Clostridia bacterium]